MPSGPSVPGQGARAVAHCQPSPPCQPVSLTLWCHWVMGGLLRGCQASSPRGGCGTVVVGLVGAQQWHGGDDMVGMVMGMVMGMGGHGGRVAQQ